MPLNIQTSDARQANVYDVIDPDRHGKVIKAGPELSEVRWDDGAERIISNVHLRTVEAPIGDRLDNPTEEAIRQGQEAWDRLRPGSQWPLLRRCRPTSESAAH